MLRAEAEKKAKAFGVSPDEILADWKARAAGATARFPGAATVSTAKPAATRGDFTCVSALNEDAAVEAFRRAQKSVMVRNKNPFANLSIEKLEALLASTTDPKARYQIAEQLVLRRKGL